MIFPICWEKHQWSRITASTWGWISRSEKHNPRHFYKGSPLISFCSPHPAKVPMRCVRASGTTFLLPVQGKSTEEKTVTFRKERRGREEVIIVRIIWIQTGENSSLFLIRLLEVLSVRICWGVRTDGENTSLSPDIWLMAPGIFVDGIDHEIRK